MKCKHTECASSSDCGIIDITGKEPNTAISCSYFRTQKKLEKLKAAKDELVSESEKKRLRKDSK